MKVADLLKLQVNLIMNQIPSLNYHMCFNIFAENSCKICYVIFSMINLTHNLLKKLLRINIIILVNYLIICLIFTNKQNLPRQHHYQRYNKFVIDERLYLIKIVSIYLILNIDPTTMLLLIEVKIVIYLYQRKF